MHPLTPRHRQQDAALLVVGALGLWILVVSTCVAVLPDCVAPVDQMERLAWVGD